MVEAIGASLRAARLRSGLSLEDVEERSQQLAQRWHKPGYRISSSWINRIENHNRDFSATKLIVLASIYGLTVEQMLEFCPSSSSEDLAPLDKSVPNATILIPPGPLDERVKSWMPDQFVTNPPPELTMLLPTPEGMLPIQYRRGIIGLKDRMLDPMVPAGSVVIIDTTKRAILSRKKGNNEFDRPIYFLYTRTGYVSGFCELDKQAEWLTLLPHLLSGESVKRWRYKKEIEVVGTVAAVFSRRSA